MDIAYLYTEKKHWDKLNKVGYVGDELGQGENYEKGCIFYDLFSAPEVKLRITIIE